MNEGISREKQILSLMTASPELEGVESLHLTGNEYLSLPEIGECGEIMSLNVLHMTARGILEFRGTGGSPLLAPFAILDGENLLESEKPSWNYRYDWIPHFKAGKPGLCSIEGHIFAPPGHRGCCFRLSLTNLSATPLKLAIGWRGCWGEFNHLIFNRRTVGGEKVIRYDNWTESLVMESRHGLPLSALAMSLMVGQEQGDRSCWDIHVSSGHPISYRGTVRPEVAPGGSVTVTLYIAVNLEADGAGTTVVDLKRHGVAELAARTECWLKKRRIDLDDRTVAAILNRNLYFNYFFALGRALDDDSLVPVTSRSPRYYVSAAYWGRDTLLWSFPALLLMDKQISRELLLTVFNRHLSRAGEHAHYINGVLLYPGFELDQLAAHFLALERYESAHGDLSLPGEGVISRGLKLLVEKARERYDRRVGLYRTFLDPSDDPVLYPFLIYDNALLQCAFVYLAKLQAAGRWEGTVDFAGLAAALKQAIHRHGTVEGPHGAMFAWAVDGKGRFQLYDNPPGSLQLLAFYGFCSREDPIFCNTVAWIRSSENPHFHADTPFAEAGSLHAPGPWPLAACNDILALNRGGTDFLRRAPMDNGFCCETVDPQTGLATTGAAFASAAGFLAHALWWASREKKDGR
ncbi:MAG: glycoside hydrolase family 125 protein [Firmicutes bacterium]|jgi:hypothetical protein|nr:glycoside hydrolase family 125 protein [Bacillota bacterium]